jgi:hypothetical protein
MLLYSKLIAGIIPAMNMSRANISGNKIVTDLKNDNSKDDLFLEEEEAEEKIDWNGLCSDELPQDMKAILKKLEKDEDFNQEIDALAKDIDGDNITELFARILAVVKSRLPKVSREDAFKLQGILRHRRRAFEKHIEDLSAYLLIRRTEEKSPAKKTMFNRLTGRFSKLKLEARKNLSALIKRFVVYEMYKILSPRQIAGETRRETFVHNMIVGGLDRALRHEGGTKSEVANYSKAFLRDLQKRHQAASRAGGIHL